MSDSESNSRNDRHTDAPDESVDPYKTPLEIPAERGFGARSISGWVLGVVITVVVALVTTGLFAFRAVEQEIKDFGANRAGPVREADLTPATQTIKEAEPDGATVMQPESGVSDDAASAENSEPVLP